MKDETSTLTIACCANDKFSPGLMLSMASALAKSSGLYHYDFVVLDGGITDSSKIKLKQVLDNVANRVRTSFELSYVNPSDSLTSALPKRAGTWMTYARFLLPELLSNRSFVIYLDSDILCLRGIEEFYTSWDGKAAIVAARDPLELAKRDWPFPGSAKLKDEYYFNAGLILMNLKWFRDHYPLCKIMRLIEDIGTQNLKFHDQTILNYITYGQSIEVPRENNWVLATKYAVDVPIKFQQLNMHYVGRVKPWLRKDTQARRFFAEYLFYRASEEFGVGAVEPRQINEQELKKVQLKAFWYKLFKPKRAKLYKTVILNLKQQQLLASKVTKDVFYSGY